ncbi:TolB family protein [Gracilibacillus massiliensis]|uniref:TolB family protein n=1 Tax=Gracilibacillus massiliensis TaxID=1564956 RepID=UPI00071D4511|nr:PD40 domain-containing protein [Gracilibacillus massiliensis]
MKRKSTFLIAIGLAFLLLGGAISYAMLSDNDQYQYFTGLGSEISIAPDDSEIAFSYFTEGEESIYTVNPNGDNVKELTNNMNMRDRNPSYSPDGSKLVYMSENKENIQSLRVINHDGSEETTLTNNDLHVTDAIFSQDGKNTYFIAMESAEFKKGEQSREGFDLFITDLDGTTIKQLTDADHFSMNHLFLSSDGQEIFFSEFDGEEERIYSYSLNEETTHEKPNLIPEKLLANQSFYNPHLSSDGNLLAFTEVANEEESTTFEYELFLLDIKEQSIEKLTDLQKSISSPTFFHNQHTIAFLANTNWAKDPAEYELMTIDLSTQNLETIALDTTDPTGKKWVMQWIDMSINGFTIAALYIVLLGLLSVFFLYYYPKKTYLASIISFAIAVLTFIASIIVAITIDAWYGIGLGMLAAVILGCSIVVVVFVIVFKRVVKRNIH